MLTGRLLSYTDKAGVKFLYDYTALGDIASSTKAPGTENEVKVQFNYTFATGSDFISHIRDITASLEAYKVY